MQGQHRTLRCRVLWGGGPAVSGLGTTKRRRGLSEPEPAVLSPEGRQPSARTARDSSNQIPLNVESCAVERKGAQGRRLSTPQFSRLPGRGGVRPRDPWARCANKCMPAHRRLDEALVTRHPRKPSVVATAHSATRPPPTPGYPEHGNSARRLATRLTRREKSGRVGS